VVAEAFAEVGVFGVAEGFAGTEGSTEVITDRIVGIAGLDTTERLRITVVPPTMAHAVFTALHAMFRLTTASSSVQHVGCAVIEVF
jgi:hypothetical protein